MMFIHVFGSLDDALMKTSIVDRGVRTLRLADESGETVFWLAGLAEELVNILSVAIILKAGTIRVKPAIASIATDP